ncbi:hypothetical protein SCH01S_16_00840 [Sphingomonas changbaiensis NBRC 104936]|uniref:DUF1203 domain-containing protein n=1 Tax=Sphingomonas changbaiensis NBRC 104936 TaxID=1219043 RepID=A0A0E9MN59_9SPHN|nr:DUF1203 domain-containing protein [Sphingomonas changbaiensis]GAO38565.1 hypothetical protein SCH01S_16_00840 [Sphingomonas changbaiensis NBRC 104936]
MTFRITGLDPEPFLDLASLSDERLAERGVVRRVSDGTGFPCRVSLEDVAAGERVLLLNYEHQPAPTPFRSSHAIYVREGERRRFDRVDDVPALLRSRLLSIRAFDSAHMLVDADVVEGEAAAEAIERFFATPDTDYLHVHYARPGCFAARVDRA